MICFNGGQIYDPYHEKTVYGKTFSKEIAVKIINEALKRDLHIQGYNDTEILAVRDTEELRKYSAVNHLPYKIVADAAAVVPKDPYKLIAISSSGAEERAKNLKFQREVIEPLTGEVHSFFPMTVIRRLSRKVFQKALRSDGSAIMWTYRLKIPLQPEMRRTTLKC